MSVPHLGGQGIELPNSLSIWFLVSVFILASIWKAINKSAFYVHRALLVFLLFLWVTFLASVINSQLTQREISLYFYAFVVLSLFPMAVLQWQIRHSGLLSVLKFIVAIGLFHSIVSIIQVHDKLKIWHSLTGYAPLNCNCSSPIGVIQQTNLHSSFMSLVVIASIYLMSYKGFWTSSAFVRWLIVISATLSLYSLLLGSSRAGMLGLILGVFLLLFSCDKGVLKNKKYLMMLLSIFVTSLLLNQYFPNDAASNLIQKTEQLFLGLDVRIDIYLATIHMIIDRPVLGYGLGSFPDELSLYINNSAEMYSESTYEVMRKVSHPHNEFLLWAFNAGLVFIIGFLIFIYRYLMTIQWRRWRFLLGVISISLPLIIQSLVSLPFFISALHLFLLMFLVVYSLRGSQKELCKLHLGVRLVKSIKIIIILFIGALVFAYVTQLVEIWGLYEAYEKETNRFLINQLKSI